MTPARTHGPASMFSGGPHARALAQADRRRGHAGVPGGLRPHRRPAVRTPARPGLAEAGLHGHRRPGLGPAADPADRLDEPGEMKAAIRLGGRMVGAAGFEPTTP